MDLLPSFAPFSSNKVPKEQLLFSLEVSDTLQSKDEKTLIKKVDTGNGDTIVWQLADGGYQFTIYDIHHRECCLLITNAEFAQCECALKGNFAMRSFGLNDALMIIYAFAGSFHHTLLIHASCVRYQDKAYPFIAQSGTGKSTHTSLWLQHIEGTDLMNDDNPIIRIQDEKVICYGSPWSGKTPCYRNIHAPLGAITQIERAKQNSIEPLSPILAFASLLQACSTMTWDRTIYRNQCDTLTKIIETTPIYTLYCLPNAEAAQICKATIVR